MIVNSRLLRALGPKRLMDQFDTKRKDLRIVSSNWNVQFQAFPMQGLPPEHIRCQQCRNPWAHCKSGCLEECKMHSLPDLFASSPPAHLLLEPGASFSAANDCDHASRPQRSPHQPGFPPAQKALLIECLAICPHKNQSFWQRHKRSKDFLLYFTSMDFRLILAPEIFLLNWTECFLVSGLLLGL